MSWHCVTFSILSGSVLVSCSYFGAHVTGSDIDQKLLHGRGLYGHSLFTYSAIECVRCHAMKSKIKNHSVNKVKNL